MTTIDSAPQPCPRCLRPTVLVTNRLGREWLHVGTWLSRCGRVVDAVEARPLHANSGLA